jgi:hypothetical protein
MKSFDELKKEFDEAVEKLRKECPHDNLSEWMDEYWAPAHSTGCMVKCCNFCSQIVRRIKPKMTIVQEGKGCFKQDVKGWQEVDKEGNVIREFKELSEDEKKNSLFLFHDDKPWDDVYSMDEETDESEISE